MRRKKADREPLSFFLLGVRVENLYKVWVFSAPSLTSFLTPISKQYNQPEHSSTEFRASSKLSKFQSSSFSFYQPKHFISHVWLVCSPISISFPNPQHPVWNIHILTSSQRKRWWLWRRRARLQRPLTGDHQQGHGRRCRPPAAAAAWLLWLPFLSLSRRPLSNPLIPLIQWPRRPRHRTPRYHHPP